MTYAGLVKRAKSHFENCNNGPEETPVQGDSSTFWPRGRWALRARRPRGPNVKKSSILTQIGRFRTVWIHQWLRNDAQSLK